jgi:hypothetical protein
MSTIVNGSDSRKDAAIAAGGHSSAIQLLVGSSSGDDDVHNNAAGGRKKHRAATAKEEGESLLRAKIAAIKLLKSLAVGNSGAGGRCDALLADRAHQAVLKAMEPYLDPYRTATPVEAALELIEWGVWALHSLSLGGGQSKESQGSRRRMLIDANVPKVLLSCLDMFRENDGIVERSTAALHGLRGVGCSSSSSPEVAAGNKEVAPFEFSGDRK